MGRNAQQQLQAAAAANMSERRGGRGRRRVNMAGLSTGGRDRGAGRGGAKSDAKAVDKKSSMNLAEQQALHAGPDSGKVAFQAANIPDPPAIFPVGFLHDVLMCIALTMPTSLPLCSTLIYASRISRHHGHSCAHSPLTFSFPLVCVLSCSQGSSRKPNCSTPSSTGSSACSSSLSSSCPLLSSPLLSSPLLSSPLLLLLVHS
jgi:hypothetical protein